MSYPITPNPAIHNAPTQAINAPSPLSAGLIEAWAKQLFEAVAGAIVNALTGGLIPASDVIGATDAFLNLFNFGNLISTIQTDATNAINWLESLISSVGGTVIGDLEAFINGLTSGADFQGLIDAIANAMGHSGTGHTASNILTYLENIPQAVVSGLASDLSTISGDINGVVDNIVHALGGPSTGNAVSDIITYLENIPQSVVTGLASALSAKALASDLQGVIDNIANAMGHSGTGHTVANILTYLGAIPQSVITNLASDLSAKALASDLQGVIDNIANALGHSGTGHTVANILTYLGSIPASVINGVLNALNIPNITKAMSTDLANLFGISTSAISSGPNVVPDPGFENATFYLGGTGGGTWSRSTTVAHTGTYSLKCVSTNAYGYQFLGGSDTAYLTVKCVPGDVYYFECYVYGGAANVGTTGTIALNVQTYNSTGGYVGNITTGATATASTSFNGAWTKLSGYYTIPSGVYSFAPFAFVNSVNAGDIYYFDDVVVKEYTQTQNVLDALWNGFVGDVAGVGKTLSNVWDALKSFFSQAVINLIPHARIPVVSASHVTNVNPNLLTSGSFDNAQTMPTTGQWSWDNTQDHTGNSGGSAKCVANGTNITLNSNAVPVVQGDQLSAGCWLMWSGVAATGTAFTLNLLTYLGSTNVATIPLQSLLNPAASNGWASGGGTYSVPAGVDTVYLQVQVTSTVTAGSIWWDDLSLTKTGPISGGLVSGLTGIGTTIVNDLQGTLDAIGQAIFGGSGSHTPATIGAGVANFPAENIVILPNPSSSGVAFDAAGSGWTPNITASTSPVVVSGTHTCAGNFAIVCLTVVTSSSGSAFPVTVTYGGVTMSNIGSTIASSWSSPASMTTSFMFGLFNPPTTTNASVVVTVTPPSGGSVYSVIPYSLSYSGVTALGSVTKANGTSTSPSMTAASLSTSNKFVQMNYMQKISTGGTETLSSYSQTNRYNPGNIASSTGPLAVVYGDATSAASVTFSATASYTAGNAFWRGMAVELESNVGFLGSGFRAYYNSSSSVSFSSATSGAVAHSGVFTSGYTGNTSDYTYNTSTYALTVSQAGWYIVKVCYYLPHSGGSAFTFGPMLYQNGYVVQWGSTIVYPAYGGTDLRATDTFLVYLNAGENIQPGYMADAGVSVSGDTYGTRTYWSVCLANRSLI